ncbi:MAG: hypothetical protein Q27BB25_07810 [Blastomonas sp. CACIA14H2]|nr:MAG: hypothetical protein Q27BB25_07810 [Blastomonas sp. CACIA14H2]
MQAAQDSASQYTMPDAAGAVGAKAALMAAFGPEASDFVVPDALRRPLPILQFMQLIEEAVSLDVMDRLKMEIASLPDIREDIRFGSVSPAHGDSTAPLSVTVTCGCS